MMWYDMTWHDIWYDVVWYDMTWYMIWCGMIWYIYELHLSYPVAVHIYTQTIHRTTQITIEQYK